VVIRDYIPLKVQLAAALLQLGYMRPDWRELADVFTRYIPHDHAKLMTADQIISLFQLDHYPIRHADGGPDEPWNLEFKFIGAHREKTKRDQAEMAKSKRIRKRLASFDPRSPVCLVEAMAADRAGLKGPRYRPKQTRKIPSRPFPKGRKFNQRNFR
jgi:hypothetical protein